MISVEFSSLAYAQPTRNDNKTKQNLQTFLHDN